ncbi:hypothetical protein D3C76_460800 [compost metagenome]
MMQITRHLQEQSEPCQRRHGNHDGEQHRQAPRGNQRDTAPSLLPEFNAVLISSVRFAMYGLISLLAALPIASRLLSQLTRRDACDIDGDQQQPRPWPTPHDVVLAG